MRYFLNIRDFDEDLIEDPEGQVFDTIEYAKAEAEAGARDMMADALRSNTKVGLDRSIEVADGGGQVLLIVTFRNSAQW